MVVIVINTDLDLEFYESKKS